MQSDQNPSFLQAFIGSFVSFKNYPNYSKRSGGSLFGHYLLVVTLCCCFYGLSTTVWLNQNLSPHLDGLAQEVPVVAIKDGKATFEVEKQPHFFKIENETIAVIDTTQEPDSYLEEYPDIIVFAEDKMVIGRSTGEQRIIPYDFEMTLDATVVQGWVDTVKSWFLPALFLLCMMWQVCWKITQVLLAATVVTLIQSSRPGFGTHMKLAIYALGPAMAFGVFAYCSSLFAFAIPSAGLIFWAILGGLTYYGSEQLKKSPEHS